MPSRVCSRYTEDQSIREMFSLKVESFESLCVSIINASISFVLVSRKLLKSYRNDLIRNDFVDREKNSCCQWYSVISIQAMDSVRISLNGNSERVEIYSSLKYMIEIQTTRLNKPLFVSLFLSVSLSVRPHSIRTQWPFNWIVRSSA